MTRGEGSWLCTTLLLDLLGIRSGGGTHINKSVPALISLPRGLLAAGALLCVGGQNTSTAYGQVAHESTDIKALGTEPIAVSPQSRVSADRTTNSLHIYVLQGTVLLKPRVAPGLPMIVTAGNARLSNIKANVCVRVERDRTMIHVFDGDVDMAVLSLGGDHHARDGVPLRAGDRVELTPMQSDVQLHFSREDSINPAECIAATLSSR